MCQRCLANGRVTPATVVDHIEPHRGNRTLFDQGELQSLCAHCHNSAKQSEETRGFSTECDVYGNPIDPKHPANR
ncbi:MAG: HNH endonuclease [Pseudomonadota bacterium]